ncbi:hypothetical protein BDV34DRAFT_187653 [Aspergillus parasiticus]|uniref:Uncharacterized protein n=1 Tax=Aspergillus parasiticus TaxID=5067 RepID=A0A5N6E0R1_ASPPA|nr:hypothetical protein BDV34DRAFT_187653 [Aspergillus parasiticus]
MKASPTSRMFSECEASKRLRVLILIFIVCASHRALGSLNTSGVDHSIIVKNLNPQS